MTEFVNFMLTHTWALIAFLVVSYLLVLAMILPVAFVPGKQKGKKIVFDFHSGQTTLINIDEGMVAKITASSDGEFEIMTEATRIMSQPFNSFTHIGSATLEKSGVLVINGGDDITIEITSDQNDVSVIHYSAPSQKFAGIMASLMLLGIWSFLGYLMLSLTR